MNDAFREWAKAQGLRVRKQPEALQGENCVWGVPLMGRRGWLWDAGPRQIGVDYRGTPRVVNPAVDALAKTPGWHLQTHAADAVVGRIDKNLWGAVFHGILRPLKAPSLSPDQRAALSERAKSTFGAG